MNSINLPPIRKIGPAIAPKPKNIQIHAGQVVWLDKHEMTNKNLHAINNKDEPIFQAKLITLPPKRDSYEFPAPPTPNSLKEQSSFNNDTSLNSTINVTTSDPSKGPVITITPRNHLSPPANNSNLNLKSGSTISIPVQHSPAPSNPSSPTVASIKPIQMNIIPNRSLNDEIDLAQQILMKSLLGSKESSVIGMCDKCKEPVQSIDSGLKAQDHLYHVKCFVCIACRSSLKDKHFYALDNKTYCESCYVDLLEKCNICDKPITDRILRATGKPFHPECFCCTVCRLNLDGVPFTVDSKNKINCIDCFHEKYAPRCHTCQQAIVPEKGQEETTRIVAMDKSFHVQCYKCEDCGVSLTTNSDTIGGCYPLDDHIYCKSCNLKRNLKKANLNLTQTSRNLSPSTSHIIARQTDL